MRQYAICAIILAAGRSRRMGQPKLVLPWGDTSILGHLLAVWRTVGAKQIAVVCARDDETISAELDRLGFPPDQRIFNPDPERGMFSSIQCAAQWNAWGNELGHWALVLGDQPHLHESTLRQLLALNAAYPDSICQPIYGGHRRHPVILPKAAFSQLAISQEASLKDFLDQLGTTWCEMDDPGLDLDIDRPEDYEEALRISRMSARNGSPLR